MDIMNAWGLGYRGHGVTVGVVDTGIEVTHADLAPNIVSDGRRVTEKIYNTIFTGAAKTVHKWLGHSPFCLCSRNRDVISHYFHVVNVLSVTT